MNRVVSAVPICSDINKDFFLQHPQLKPTPFRLGETDVFTAPLLINKVLDLIGISLHRAELDNGNLDETMSLGKDIALAAVYIELGPDLIRVECPVLKSYVQAPGAMRPYYDVNFTTTVHLNAATKSVDGENILLSPEYASGETITCVVRGSISPDIGRTEMIAGKCRIANKGADELHSLKEEYFASAKVVAYDLLYTLEHINVNNQIQVFADPNPTADEHEHRKVIVGASIEYLKTLDSNQFKFLMSEIYKVENVKDLVSFFSDSNPSTILAMLQAALSCDPRYDIVKYFTYDIVDTNGDPIICAATIPEFTGAYSPLQLYYKDSDEVDTPVYLDSVKIILKVNESAHMSDKLELGCVGVEATIAGISGYELPTSWFEYKFDKVVVESDVDPE